MTKLKITSLCLVILTLTSCGNRTKRDATYNNELITEGTATQIDTSTNKAMIYYYFANISGDEKTFASMVDSIANISNGKSLNEIRFDNWTVDDWYENDYFRALRSHFDACYKGEIEDKSLEPYKSLLNGQFIISDAKQFIAGGLFIDLLFIDAPNKIFRTNVYSYVDVVSETVTGYSVRDFMVDESELEMTKEEILKIVKEHPEIKYLW